MRSILIVALLSTACARVAQADTQTLENLAATEVLAENAARLIAAGKLRQAYSGLKPFWPLPPHEIDALIYQAEGQRPTIAARFGNSLAMERAGTQVLGDSFIRYVFLEKYERHAIVWVFTFYRPKDTWVLNSALYTDDFSTMFEWLPGAPGSPGARSQQATTPPDQAFRLTASSDAN